MTLDASIYGQIQQPRQPDQLNMLAQAMQIKGYQAQMDKADRAEQQQNRLLSVLQSPEFQQGDGATRARLAYGAGDVDAASKITTSTAAANKDQREAEKAELAMAIDRYGASSGGFAEIAKNPAAAQQILGHMVQSKIIDPGYAQKVLASASQAPDPAAFWMQGAQAAISAKDKLTLQLQQQAQAITMRGQDLTQQTALRGQDLSRDTSLRGQDLTDTRAREFNATRVEENKLKREQKQETADMTKAGQIASFDTMLGTLDRLGQHPGLQRSVGLIGKLPTMPGSDSANFQAELDTFQSQAFVPMVAQLKGMGALSDAEGRKLTQAVGALNPNMGEKAFRESIKRITDDMNAARARVVGNKGAAVTPPSGGLDASGIEAELRKRGLLK